MTPSAANDDPRWCPFCNPDPQRVFLRLRHVYALWDGFPVTDGHALIVPYRHVPTWFDASSTERSELFSAIDAVCSIIRERGGIDGFNFGVNVGAAAGQTVPHLHQHVIPRRTGDMPDPRGGVRHVIPGKGNYLITRDAPRGPSIADAGPGQPWRIDSPPLLTTGPAHPLLPHLEHDLSTASRVDIAVAFVMPSGVERLYAHFDDLLRRGGSLRLLTGDYLGVTDPDALQRLIDLRAIHGSTRLDLRVYVTAGRSFHPKAYLLTGDYADGVAWVGSSNLSASALSDGIEWNYRVESRRDSAGLALVRGAFEALFADPATRDLDDAWLADYRGRRPALAALATEPAGELPEPTPDLPVPNPVQTEALTALMATRAEGARAGLVVMATGLGKTWLAAFDIAGPQFRRVLFVAHREEILHQALATFRRIRPDAVLGLYNGSARVADAEILFASIQTLSRREHLDRFDPHAFDYIIVDEFHHASAASYRRLIEHFDPKFLLGLTATPERTDGGNLLALCGENLVYRCGVPRGIGLDLLCAYRYFGVPDEVDYRNVPWKSGRFDETELTAAVATELRAANIVEQWRKRAGKRTLAFCVSQRHADYMKRWFLDAGIPCAAVHAGPGADPRALSLEQLAAAQLKVVFAVDMFNEGVDVPAIDTVMMLRPTESAVIWLQQFGRGLRKHGDKRLTVIDYIGNHRSFLTKVRALLAIEGGGDRAIAAALRAWQEQRLGLPVGCEVTYELLALDILRALLRTPADGADALRDYYQDFRDRHGQRPTASEAFHDGYLPRSARTAYGSWFGLVRDMGGFSAEDEAAWSAATSFLSGLETTTMVKSYKMLVLQAMLNTNTLPSPLEGPAPAGPLLPSEAPPEPGIHITTLTDEFARLARRLPALTKELGPALDDPVALRRLIETNPINAWTGSGAIKDEVAFAYQNQSLRYLGTIPPAARDAFRGLVRELVDWRLAEYLLRPAAEADHSSFVMSVKHAGGNPILFLPDRERTPSIPEQGWHDVTIDGESYRANFVKIAVNVVCAADSDKNVLSKILRGWFGPDAGLPGTDFKVSSERADGGWTWKPLGRAPDEQPEVFRRYSREQIPRLFGDRYSEAIWNSGFVVITTEKPRAICLLVTIDREGMSEQFQYQNRFLAPDRFQWQSQNRTAQDSKYGRLIRDHQQLGVTIHLFVRAEKKRGSAPAAFLYCGTVAFEKWEGSEPVTVDWRLHQPVPERLLASFGT
jgi:superfamily II DNA or RNA helicase/diadenosine tetraphosphate (Ap4A) HIT family hydrolase/HKD family nuclease